MAMVKVSKRTEFPLRYSETAPRCRVDQERLENAANALMVGIVGYECWVRLRAADMARHSRFLDFAQARRATAFAIRIRIYRVAPVKCEVRRVQPAHSGYCSYLLQTAVRFVHLGTIHKDQCSMVTD